MLSKTGGGVATTTLTSGAQTKRAPASEASARVPEGGFSDLLQGVLGLIAVPSQFEASQLKARPSSATCLVSPISPQVTAGPRLVPDPHHDAEDS